MKHEMEESASPADGQYALVEENFRRKGFCNREECGRMNVAILFDTMECAEIGAGELLASEPLYGYSLKRFYLHPSIDGIAIVWQHEMLGTQIKKDIGKWEGEYGIRKKVGLFKGSSGLGERPGLPGQIWQAEVDLYVFHDIRYPFVTESMIYMVEQKAAMHGLAAIAGETEGNMVSRSGQEAYRDDGFRYLKFPMSARADCRIIQEAEKSVNLQGFLQQFMESRPYLCNVQDRNLAVYSKESMEIAEAVLRVKKRDTAEASYRK